MTNQKDKLNKLCDSYSDIFAKHATDTGITYLVQMTIRPKTNIKSLDKNKLTHYQFDIMPGLGMN